METMERQMTVKEILADVCKVLGEINVPVNKVQEIGIPIANSINGIRVCLDAIARAEAESTQVPQKKDDEPEIQAAETGENVDA